MTLWTVYRRDDPARFSVVSFPTYSPDSIKAKYVRETMGIGYGVIPDLLVRRAMAEEAEVLTGNEHWIRHCSVNDGNWRSALERLNLEEVDRLLELETRKTALQKLRSKKRRLEKEGEGLNQTPNQKVIE